MKNQDIPQKREFNDSDSFELLLNELLQVLDRVPYNTATAALEMCKNSLPQNAIVLFEHPQS